MSAMSAKQFSKTLAQVPDEILAALVVKIGSVRPPLKEPHTKKRLIAYIVKHKDSMNIKCVNEHKDSGISELSEEELQQRVSEHQKFVLLMLIFQDVADGSKKYTQATLVKFLEVWYKIPETQRVIMKRNSPDQLNKFVEYSREIKATGRSDVDTILEVKSKFQELMFDIIDKEIYFQVCHQVISQGASLADRQSRTPELMSQLTNYDVESVMINSVANVDLNKVVNQDVWCPHDFTEDMKTIPSTKIIKLNEPKEPEEQTGGATGMTAHVPDIEEAPPLQPVQPVEAIPPASTEPVVHKIEALEEQAKEILDKSGGSLMFPTEYRQIKISDITKTSWNKLRKSNELKGRWSIYMKTDPDFMPNPRQNKAITYTCGHCVDENWQGAEFDGAMYFTLHPYGDLYLVQG